MRLTSTPAGTGPCSRVDTGHGTSTGHGASADRRA